MARPLSYEAARGTAITLDDLRDFVAEAYAKGYPGDAEPRMVGRMELDVTYGPRIQRLTLIPGEASGD
jgi:hypothetical protein